MSPSWMCTAICTRVLYVGAVSFTETCFARGFGGPGLRIYAYVLCPYSESLAFVSES